MFCIVVTIDGQQRRARSSLATCFRHSVCDYMLIIANKAERSSLTLVQYYIVLDCAEFYVPANTL